MSDQRKALREALKITVAATALAASTAAAVAGGIAVREQSTHFQGMSFAGNAAGGALSSMFWNPAAAAQFNGINTESGYALIIPDSEIHALPGSTLLGLGADSGNIGNMAVVPSSYFSYQLSPHMVFGLSVNSPFGLSTEPSNRIWAGQTHTRTSDVKTYNFSPTLAYRLAPGLAIGVGVQVQRIEARLKNAAGAGNAPNAIVEADDFAAGFTAGVLWSPNPGTSIGLGFRSAIDHELEGRALIAGIPVTQAGIGADVTLPETVTLSVRQAVSPLLTVLGTVEWTNWSRLDQIDIVCQTPSAVVCAGGPGSTASTLPLGWHDGWFFALGAEYAWSPLLTLRGGVAYELSPIQDPDERTPRVPDADRFWASIGASYKWSERVSLDFAYTHIFVDDSTIDRTASAVRLLADVDSQVDIVSVGLKIKLGDEPPPAPLK